MSITQIKACTCDHKEQDKDHGKNQRVHNQAGGTKSIKWRCTVCNNEKS